MHHLSLLFLLLMGPKIIGPVEPIQTASQGTTVEVNLGKSEAAAGDPVFLPLTLAVSGDLKIRKVVTEIEVLSTVFEILAIRPLDAAEKVQANIQTETREVPDNIWISILRVTIEAEEAIPPGNLASLAFWIPAGAEVGVAELPNRLQEVWTLDGQKVQSIQGNHGSVTISPSLDPFHDSELP